MHACMSAASKLQVQGATSGSGHMRAAEHAD